MKKRIKIIIYLQVIASILFIVDHIFYASEAVDSTYKAGKHVGVVDFQRELRARQIEIPEEIEVGPNKGQYIGPGLDMFIHDIMVFYPALLLQITVIILLLLAYNETKRAEQKDLGDSVPPPQI